MAVITARLSPKNAMVIVGSIGNILNYMVSMRFSGVVDRLKLPD